MGPNRRVTTRQGGNRFEVSVLGVCNGISTWAAYVVKQNMARAIGISPLESDYTRGPVNWAREGPPSQPWMRGGFVHTPEQTAT